MIGNILVTAGLISGLFSLIMYYFTLKGKQNTLFYARMGYNLMAVLVIAAAAFLLQAIITHQYQYHYVYNYSNDDLSLGLLMSTFYAGQEGSFMLWLLFTAIIGLILQDYTSKRENLEPKVMLFFTLSASFLLMMVSPLLKSPFNYIWAEGAFIDVKNINPGFLSLPFMKSFMFSDPNQGTNMVQVNRDLYGILAGNGISMNQFIIHGKGLNPLLQNFWMQIHPPILFVGFSMSAVPFAFAMSAILENDYTKWIKQALPWTLSGAMVLGLAIMLGGYWAYGVLGWGGYWGWDPVENSSLVPWLVGVASVHTMLVQKRTAVNGNPGRFLKTNLILSMLTYILVLYSTFLTRSGILGNASVHSFVDPGNLVYFFLLLFIGTFIVIGVSGFVARWSTISQQMEEENLLSRELALFTGSVALIGSALIVLVGTSAPIFDLSVDTSFYNMMNLPIAIIIGVLNGLSLILKWKQTDKSQLMKDLKIDLLITVVVTAVVAVWGGITDIMLILLTLASAFTLIVNGEIAFRIIKGRLSHLGAYVAHIGIALFFLGVLATGGFSDQTEIELHKGVTKSAFGYNLTYTGYNTFDNGKKYAFNIEVKKGNSKDNVAPVMFISEMNNGLMREPDILNHFTKDLYISPLGYNESEGQGSKSLVIRKGESSTLMGSKITFVKFNMPSNTREAMMSGKPFKIGAELVVEKDGKSFSVEPYLENTGASSQYVSAKIPEIDMEINLTKIDASGAVSLQVEGENTGKKAGTETLTVEASIKPFINLVWAGVLITTFGFFVSLLRRSKESLQK